MPEKYEGQKNEKGQAHGLGIETTDEYEYKGQFESGIKTGFGVYKCKDGTIIKINSDNKEVNGFITYPTENNILSYAGAIVNLKPGTHGRYSFKEKIIIGNIEKDGNGSGKIIMNINSPNNHYYLGMISNFEPHGLGYEYNNDGSDKNRIGNFSNGKLTGLGETYNTEKKNNKEEKTNYGIGNFENFVMTGLGKKYEQAGTLKHAVLEKGYFKYNYLNGWGIKEWPYWQTENKYKEFDKYKNSFSSKNPKNLYYDSSTEIYISSKNDQTVEKSAKELEENIKTVVNNANEIVKDAETQKTLADTNFLKASSKASFAINTVVDKAVTIEKEVDEAIQALKNAAIKSYKDKIDEVNPKKIDSKFAILEKNDHTYAGQVNDSNEPDGYGVKTYKDKQRKMEGIFKDNSFVFGKYTNGTKASSGFFNKEVLTGFGKDNDDFFSDIHGESVKEVFSEKMGGKDKYLVAEIEKNLDNDVTKVVDQKAKPNANLAAEKIFKELMEDVKDYVYNNWPVEYIQLGEDEFFVGLSNGYGVRKYNKTIITGIFQRLVFKFGLVVEGEKKLYGFFEDENTPKICVDETGKPVDNQPFTDIHFLNHISLNLKGEAETAVKKAEDMKRDKEKEIADETEKAQKKAAQDFYDTELTSGTTHIPKSEVASTGHLKISESNYFGEINSSNQPHGFGELTLKNGNVYKGRFINGVKDGVGQLSDNKGVVSYSGFFKNDDKYDLTTGFTGSKDALKKVMKENEKIKIDPFIAKHVNPVIEQAKAEDAKIVAQTAAQTEYDEKITNVINAEYPDPHTYVYKKPIGNDFFSRYKIK